MIIGKFQVVPSCPCCSCCEHNSNRNKEWLNVYFPQLQFILGASLQFTCPLDGAPGLARENRKRERTATRCLRSPSSGHSLVSQVVCVSSRDSQGRQRAGRETRLLAAPPLSPGAVCGAAVSPVSCITRTESKRYFTCPGSPALLRTWVQLSPSSPCPAEAALLQWGFASGPLSLSPRTANSQSSPSTTLCFAAHSNDSKGNSS